MTMAEIIRRERKKKDLTQEELAKMLGLQASAVAKYESGRVSNIKRSTIEKMAKIFDCSPAYLLGLAPDAAHMEVSAIPSSLQDYPGIRPITTHRVPLLGSIACGEPIFANEEHESYIEAGTDIRADFALKASGDSMTGARILDGDVVFIRRQNMVDNGDIAAVAIGDEVTLKRVYYYPDEGRLMLISENPKYSPFLFVGPELDGIYILGRAIAFQSDIR